MSKIILISLLISNICIAQNAVHLGKDEKAPFDGDLLTVETVKSLYNDSLEKSSLQKQLDLTNNSLDISEKKNSILLNQNTSLVEAGVKDHTLNNWEKAGYFLAGILVTGAAIKGVQALR